ncbi:MAG TPA: hypothetical protein VKR82_16805 [Candidatus Acidoferrales bacterium]|nr:hypothetical protein [Candidatus Acidoferrales bacterium]
MRGARLFLIVLLLSGGGKCAAQGIGIIGINLVTDPSGIALTGSGTTAAVMSLGTVQAYGGTVPTGVTKNLNATSFTLNTIVDLQVTFLGILSPSYTLTAQLLTTDVINTWKINSKTLSTTATTITSSGAYGTTPVNFALTVPFSEAAGTFANTIEFIVTSN